ncbi:MAG: Tm-1-like ATP-binding domain-containing protein [Pirellula sp.]|jgi:uncharacterized protein (UPF0261 family)|nr:Tm-1-like ATP-binding domain-containing protein [Pirellula sp.]
MTTIAVMGTLDTKGADHGFVADVIRSMGCDPLLIDLGTSAPPTRPPDIDRFELRRRYESITGKPLAEVSHDRGMAIAQMGEIASVVLRQLVEEKRIDGVISLGGTGGTSMATQAMRGLPMGFPKVMVSTVAGGDVSAYVDISDIVMVPSVVDVSGLNRVSVGVYRRAAAAVVAMARANAADEAGSTGTSQQSVKPLIVASMFGNTTRCVEHAKSILEQHGYEVLVFHATGIGGRTMESLIDAGWVTGVLDITTTEWADEMVGGVLRGGPHRLEAAARRGVPAVVTPGCLDMVNFREPSTIPERFAHRRFYQHNPQVTLMRTTPEECAQLGIVLAEKLNRSIGPVCFLYPLRGISVISAKGQPFYDPAADEALRTNLKARLRKDIPFEEIDADINSAEFAERCALRLLELIETSRD